MKLSERDRRTRDEGGDEHREIGKPATKKGRTLLLASLFVAGAYILVLTIGVALLQNQIHKRKYLGNINTIRSYNDSLQSAHYTPYPESHHKQWMLLWWIIAGSMALWAFTVLLTMRAVRIIQWRAALIGFHIYFLVLCTFAIDSFLWIAHYDYNRNYFGYNRVNTVIAGLFGLAIADGLIVLALGLIANKNHLDNRHLNTGIRERIVEKEVQVPAAPRDAQYESHMPDRHEERVFTNNAPAPVHVHQGGARVTESKPTMGHSDPVKVHMDDTVPASRRY